MNIQQQQRIARAKTAVEAYAEVSGGSSFEETISDLLADLMHFVDHIREPGQPLEFDFDDFLDTAKSNYDAEVKENEE